MRESIKNWGRNFLSPITNLFIKLNIPANLLTISALPASILAGYFIANRSLWAGIVFIVIVALFDTLDGEIARKTGTI
ncbi:MAG: CDP-alcohol phosphatidyltransferase family protein, partial [candidate division WOR-3 bacterium]|nr:CDP-alcohol phosphatidyltransferase family protein [candidate division WOR-3 bacterium]